MSQSETLNNLPVKPKRSWAIWLTELLIVTAVMFFLITLLLPSILNTREAARCAVCMGKMKRIGVALQNYHDQHGSFPPAYTVDAEGNPLHSWRTLILPHFEEQKWKEIYDQIHFDEPWNSEYNRQFNEDTEHDTFAYSTEEERQRHSLRGESRIDSYHNMPSVYYCPSCESGEETVKTVYKMVVGDNAIGNVHGTSKSQITRPLGETILVIEAGLPVPWMSPSDFTVEDFKTAVCANDNEKVHAIRTAHIDYEWVETGVAVIDGEKVHQMRQVLKDPLPDPELSKCQIIGGHWLELHILFADGTVKRYMNKAFPSVSKIEAMSRVRE